MKNLTAPSIAEPLLRSRAVGVTGDGAEHDADGGHARAIVEILGRALARERSSGAR
jgi:hypothetical protein